MNRPIYIVTFHYINCWLLLASHTSFTKITLVVASEETVQGFFQDSLSSGIADNLAMVLRFPRELPQPDEH